MQAVEKLIVEGILGSDPASVAEFFHTNASLNKFKIGKYLGALYAPHLRRLLILINCFTFN
jgi:hypothetical protein